MEMSSPDSRPSDPLVPASAIQLQTVTARQDTEPSSTGSDKESNNLAPEQCKITFNQSSINLKIIYRSCSLSRRAT